MGFPLASPTSASGVLEAIRNRIEERIAVLAPSMPPECRTVATSTIVHISNGLYTVGLSAGATNTAVRAEVRRALLSYVHALREET